MKTLYLLRHAKSSWDDPRLADHERPLAPRGREAARRLAKHMARAKLRPELVLCSSAARAVETYEALAGALRGPEVSTEDGLYGAGTEDLLARLRQVGEGVRSVMLVGHNPGLADLAAALAGSGEPADLGRLRDKLPTGALAVLSFDGAWAALRPGCASLESLVVPRDL